MIKKLLIIPVLLFLMACGGGKNKNPTPVITPSKTTLTAPAQNAVCTTGTIISNTQSSIAFKWDASDNTDSYDLVVKNLLTSATVTQNTINTSLSLSLARNTPYSWYVISKSTKSTSTGQSDTWKFYNSGPGIVTYAPFPAEITSPTFGQSVTTATVNLTWQGSAVNMTSIANYDVYFGTTTSPALLKGNVTDSFVNNVSVSAKTTYYWKVITKDINGNTSDSGLYQFTTN